MVDDRVVVHYGWCLGSYGEIRARDEVLDVGNCRSGEGVSQTKAGTERGQRSTQSCAAVSD